MATNPKRSFWKGKRVLVTGHTGFKGVWLSEVLLELGAKVSGIALEPSTVPNLFEIVDLGSRLDNSIFLDITDSKALDAELRRLEPEIVFHLAAQALVLPSYESPAGTYMTNVMGTVHVLESARRCESVQTVINVTSDKCYENVNKDQGYVESDPMGGFDPYSSSKGCAELVTAAYRRSFFIRAGKGLASARAGNVIGGGDWAANRLIPDCIRALKERKKIEVRSPLSIRPWQHVLEPIFGYLLLAERVTEDPKTFAEGWNFGPNEQDARTVEEVVQTVVKNWKTESLGYFVSGDKAPHEAKLLKLDNSKARQRIEWSPRLNFEEAIKWTCDWYNGFIAGKDSSAIVQEQIRKYFEL